MINYGEDHTKTQTYDKYPYSKQEREVVWVYLGAHLSISQGYRSAVTSAIEIGGNTFQFFTRNPRGGRAKKIDSRDVEQSIKLCQSYGFGSLIGHAPYTINLASPTERTREFAIMALKEDLVRIKSVGATYLAVHPGSHVGDGIDRGLTRIIEGLNRVFSDLDLPALDGVMLLLEGMAGEGSEIGGLFEQLNCIRRGINYQDRVGVILDTCHLYAAGYDIRSNLNQVLENFDRVVGLEHLKAFHINDSKYPLGSRRDRHANLGEGYLGLEFFVKFIRHPLVQELPLILETPGDITVYAKEIAFLKSAIKRKQ